MKQRTKALLAGVISGAAFAGLVGGLILWLPSYKQKKEVEAIKPVETAAPIIKEPEATPDPAAEEAAQRTKYADLIARNPDFAGWIEIPGVDIDLPILQTTDNYFYLYHDLDRADDKRGMPFADFECDMKNGRHLIIYGHNMGVNNTDRFSNLQKYRFALDGLLGYNLYGSSAGIVGTGRIGAAMARICHGFGMTVLAYDQYRNPALDGIVRYVELDELLRTADLISLHCPLTAETRHIINADTIKMMRDNAILVNTSRGGLIDTNALIDALRARKFAGVGLDVYEDEDGQVFEDFSDDVLQNEVVPILMSFPNVVVTSHQAFFTRTALQSIAITTMENARAFARGEKLVNEVKG